LPTAKHGLGLNRMGVRVSPNIFTTCGFRTALLGSVAGTLALAILPTQVLAAGGAETITVTGSRIPQSNLTTTSPVTQVGNVDVRLGGTSRVEDVVKNLPQVFSVQNSTVSNGSSGTATVNLRNLGSSRTLVLINGRRVVPGDPGAPYADLNFIPGTLVDHIDVVTGGAGAVYGADAVSGVVNFIMKSNFEGIQVDGSYGFYNHKNTNKPVEALLIAKHSTNPTYFNNPPTNYNGGATKEGALTIGTNFADGKGNVTAYLDYRNVQPILQSHYDYSACSLSSGVALTACGGSSTTSPPRLITLGAVGPSLTPIDALGNLGPYSSATGAFNFGPYNYYQRPDTRYSGGMFAHYEVGPSFEAYAEAMFMDDNTDAQIAPSGNFLQVQSISCDNPFITGAGLTALGCGVAGADQDPATAGVQNYLAFGTPGIGAAQVAIGKRNVEGGGRDDVRRHSEYRMLLGARGALSDRWSYDLSGQFSQSILSETYQHDFSVKRLANAFNVHPVAGVPTCQSVIDGTDPDCVPYNIFQTGGVTPAMLAYVQMPSFELGTLTEQVVTGILNGDMGFSFPMAQEPIKLAIGGEYRRETLKDLHDIEALTGDLAGQGGAHPDVTGSFDVQDAFFEARIPFVQNREWFKDVSMDIGYRYSKYSTGPKTGTYKVEGNWSPTDDFRIRASYNRAVRAPQITELFSSQSVGLDGGTDPCSGPLVAGLTGDGYNAAQCLLTGVSGAQFGSVLASTAGQYNGLLGGNTALRPEVGSTWTFGVVATPTMVPGLSVTVDYSDIKINHLIGGIGADLILSQCASTGNAALCSLIHRAPGTGSLWLSSDGYVDDRLLNTGSVENQAVDIAAGYSFDLAEMGAGNFGSIQANFIGSDLIKLHVNPLPGTSTGNYDCQGLVGPPNCAGNPQPKWRHTLAATWETPWDFALGVSWRYISGVTHFNDPHPTWFDHSLAAVNYIDFNGEWDVSKNVALRAGLNNAFDENPPIVGTDPLTGSARGGSALYQNGNALPSVYEVRGRLFFMGFTIKG